MTEKPKTESEADRRRDEALKHMLNTPPKPRARVEAKGIAKSAKATKG